MIKKIGFFLGCTIPLHSLAVKYQFIPCKVNGTTIVPGIKKYKDRKKYQIIKGGKFYFHLHFCRRCKRSIQDCRCNPEQVLPVDMNNIIGYTPQQISTKKKTKRRTKKRSRIENKESHSILDALNLNSTNGIQKNSIPTILTAIKNTASKKKKKYFDHKNVQHIQQPKQQNIQQDRYYFCLNLQRGCTYCSNNRNEMLEHSKICIYKTLHEKTTKQIQDK